MYSEELLKKNITNQGCRIPHKQTQNKKVNISASFFTLSTGISIGLSIPMYGFQKSFLTPRG